jgi:hypothetical protein
MPYFVGSLSKHFRSAMPLIHGIMLSQKMFIAGVTSEGSSSEPT